MSSEWTPPEHALAYPQMREIGFEDMDGYWEWRELALQIGRKPAVRQPK